MKPERSLCIFPFWKNNPYPNIMALASAAAGFNILGPTQLPSLIAALARLGRDDVLHLQWTSPIVQRAVSTADARQRLKRFERALDQFARRGGRIVWTVHNAMPHEMAYEDEERMLVQYLARVSSVIHVMNPQTAAVMASDVTLPDDKVVVIPHPSFVGIYSDQWTRESARESFGINPGDRALVFVGQIRPYKGIEILLNALQSLRRREADETVLLLAGMVSRDDVGALERLLPSAIRVDFQPGFVEDSALSRWYRAADLAVLPYQRILNSGSAHLAATFGVPVVLPDAAHIRSEFEGQSWVHYFDSAIGSESLGKVVMDPSTYIRNPDQFRDFNESRSPWKMSQDFFHLVISR